MASAILGVITKRASTPVESVGNMSRPECNYEWGSRQANCCFDHVATSGGGFRCRALSLFRSPSNRRWNKNSQNQDHSFAVRAQSSGERGARLFGLSYS